MYTAIESAPFQYFVCNHSQEGLMGGMSKAITGGCLCGEVSYRAVVGDSKTVAHCYCSMCRRLSVVERLSPMPSFRRRTLPTPRASRNISSRLTLPCVDFAEAAVVSSPFSTSENERKSPRASGSPLAAWIGRMRLNPLTISSQLRNSLGFIWISNWLIGPASSLGFAQASIPPETNSK